MRVYQTIFDFGGKPKGFVTLSLTKQIPTQLTVNVEKKAHWNVVLRDF